MHYQSIAYYSFIQWGKNGFLCGKPRVFNGETNH